MDKNKLSSLYRGGKSMTEIATLLHCSVHKIVYWMDKYDIKRRNLSDALYVKLNPNGDPFAIKTTFDMKDMFLLGLGIGIYWGEGEKVTKHAIRVANTDPYIIKTFVKFLINICQLNKDKISYSIVCFNDSNTMEVKNYWSKQLKIFPEKFGKIVNIPSQGIGIYRKKSQFGVCTVTASNIKLKAWLMHEINNLKADIV